MYGKLPRVPAVMTIPIYIDSCAWNYLFDNSIDLKKELPPERYSIFITREVEIEIMEIRDEGEGEGGHPVDNRPLKRYVYENMEANRIRTLSVFGFMTQDADGEPLRNQLYGGFNCGTFQSEEDRGFYASEAIRRALIGKTIKEKSGLSKNQADASLAARSFDSIILTNENKRKAGPLRIAAEQGGRVVFLTDEVKPSGLSLGDYLNKFAAER